MRGPHLSMGNRPDGTPWVISADFGEQVRVDAYGDIVDTKKRISPLIARAKAAALIAAADWVENRKSAQIEQSPPPSPEREEKETR